MNRGQSKDRRLGCRGALKCVPRIKMVVRIANKNPVYFLGTATRKKPSVIAVVFDTPSSCLVAVKWKLASIH